MARTFRFSNTTSGLTLGGAFTHELLDAAAGTDQITATSGGGTNAGFFATDVGIPGTGGATGNYTIVLNVQTAAGGTTAAVRIHRVNSSGTIQTSSAFTADQSTATTGDKTYSFTSQSLGTWVSGDRFVVEVRVTNNNAHGGAAGPTFNHAAANARADTPFAAAGQEITGGTIASTAALFPPSVTPVLTAGTVPSGSTLSAPSVAPVVTSGTVASTASLFAPSVVPVVTSGTIASESQLFAPSVAGDAQDVTGGTVASTSALYPPIVLQPRTTIGIDGKRFTVNGAQTHPGKLAQGALINSRMVLAFVDDEGSDTIKNYPDTSTWDPQRNVDEFCAAVPTYAAYGLQAVTMNMQGGYPGYGGTGAGQTSIITAYNSNGSLKPAWVTRMHQALTACDQHGIPVILGLFYFGQSHRLANEAAIIAAVDNVCQELVGKGYTNVLIEIANELDVGYGHDILTTARVGELITQVQGYGLKVSVSYAGGTLPPDDVIEAVDYVLLHGNNLGAGGVATLVDDVRARAVYIADPKPILYNEDSVTLANFHSAFVNRDVGWGYYDQGTAGAYDGASGGFQSLPVDWGISQANKVAFFARVRQYTAGVIQSVSASANATSVAVSLTAAPRVGRHLVGVHFTRAPRSAGATGFAGPHGEVTNTVEADQMRVWYRDVQTGDGTGPYTFLHQDTGGAPNADVGTILLIEVDGFRHDSPTDQTATTGRTTGVQSLSTGTTATTTQARELALALMAQRATANGASWTNDFWQYAKAGVDGAATCIIFAGVKALSTTQTVESTCSWTGSNTAMGLMTTWQQAPASVDITAGTIASGSQLFPPSIGAVDSITGGTIASGSTLTPPAVTPVVVAGTVASASQVHAPAVAPVIAGGTIPAGSAVHAPSVTPTIVAGTVTSTSAVHAPSLTITVTAGTIASAAQMFAPSVSTLDTIVAGTIASASVLHAPSVTPTIVAGTIAAASTLTAPSVAPVVVSGTIASASTLFAPSVTPVLTTGTIASTSTLHAPALSVVVTTGTIASGSQAHAPAVTPRVVAGTIASASALHAPTVTPVVTAGTIAAGSQLFAPLVNTTDVIFGATIPAGSVLHAPSLQVTLTGGTIAAASELHAPSVTLVLLSSTITSTAALFAPSVVADAGLVTGTVASGSAVFAPSIAVYVTAGTIAAGSTLTPPSVAMAVVGGTVVSQAQVYAPAVQTVVLGGTIASTAELFPPRVGDIFLIPDAFSRDVVMLGPSARWALPLEEHRLVDDLRFVRSVQED